ncbi:hypothetical protein AB833_07470 [Chromatiales bacterium (ex Bugula neritina AB1)]|nr:hypothetical protein AB833_07470 [Chromatiales bacterium (ex Bugula neritina AB1)]
MVETGTMNTLVVCRTSPYGTFLEGGDHGEIMLLKESPAVARAPGDKIDVFVYVDSDDTLLASVTRPAIVAGECGALTVSALTDSGAFLDWGMKSDLFVPRSHQMGDMAVGQRCVVMALVDELNGRMIGTTRLYDYLEDENAGDFKSGQKVELLICQETDLGYKAVIDGTHLGVIYRGEIFQPIAIGDQLPGYIKEARSDLKIDLALQLHNPEARTEIEAKILQHLKKNNGESTLTDKSRPEDIYRTFNVSKKVYKHALGALYRNRLILLTKEKVSLV